MIGVIGDFLKPKAILLMGPTAAGKTDLSLKLADIYPIEIISVDSALIYRDMNIGTAKPTAIELTNHPHHLIDIISPLESFSVAEFVQTTNTLIHDISLRGKIPLLVGGTMMYYNALLNGISELPLANQDIRDKLEQRILLFGLQHIYDELKQVDPIATDKINAHDKQRIMRALEVFYITGQPITQLQQATNNKLANSVDFLTLSIIPENRETMHTRINQRFENMLTNGFIEEVESLQKKYPELTSNHTAMRCVGYYQVWQYLSNQINKDALLQTGMAATRQLAKRQITWLRKLNSTNIANDKLIFEHMFNALNRHVKIFCN